MFAKVLVANRGEIAIRVIRALRGAGDRVASPSTPSSIATRCTSQRADEAYLLGGPTAAESYLKVEQDPRGRAASPAPRRSIPATASWPRTPPFAQACEEAGIIFIGPPASAIEAMGSKTRRAS